MVSNSRSVSVCLILILITGIATASLHPLTNHATMEGSDSRSIAKRQMSLAEISKPKRVYQPLGFWGEQYALPHGWSVTVSSMSLFMNFGSQAASAWFDNFYWRLQIACAARMRNNSPYLHKVVVTQNTWRLTLTMHQQSPVQQIEWSFVYYFAMYMRNWVRNGYTGAGALKFKHTSGVIMMVAFVNLEGNIGPVVF